MKVMDCLNADQRYKLESIKKQNKPNHSRREQYSQAEWEEMMGYHIDTFKRVKGAIRQR
ncbi:hypothetical protein [Bacillus sp. 1P06AnD]|uniref:hypothetical protein n=1 Tax=Bacillus sp. 1P06AnD TaxID=3132208 RepID=UPI00399F6874